MKAPLPIRRGLARRADSAADAPAAMAIRHCRNLSALGPAGEPATPCAQPGRVHVVRRSRAADCARRLMEGVIEKYLEHVAPYYNHTAHFPAILVDVRR